MEDTAKINTRFIAVETDPRKIIIGGQEFKTVFSEVISTHAKRWLHLDLKELREKVQTDEQRAVIDEICRMWGITL